MSRKKTSGLSKEVPAIFEGIPRFDEEPPLKKRRSQFPTIRILPSSTSPSTSLKILFEIGESKAKALLMKIEQDQPKIVGIRKHTFPVTAEGKRQENPEKLGGWLIECIQEFAAGKSYEARLLLMGRETYLCEVEKPPVVPKPKRDAYLWQIAEKLPFPAEDSELIFEEKETTTLMAVVHRFFLHARLTFFHDIGIYPELVTFPAMAYEALNRQYSLFPEKNVLLIHLGETQTSLFIFQNGEFKSMRDIPLGEEHVIQAMIGTLVVGNQQISIGFEEAEALKEALGLPTPNLMSDPEKEPKLSRLSERMRPIFEKMVSEIKISMSHFQKQFQNQKIEAVYLAGSGAELKGLDAYFSTQLDLSARKLNIQKVDPGLDLSLAALAGLGNTDPHRLNFASPEDVWKPRFETGRFFLKRGSFVLAVIFSLPFAIFSVQMAVSQSALGGQQRKLESLGPTAQAVETLYSLSQAISERRRLLAEEVGTDPLLGEALKELSHLIQPSMKLKKISFQKGPPTMSLEGTVETQIQSPDLVLSDFLENLNQSGLFEHSSLESRSMEEGSTAVQFLIRVQLTGGHF